METAISTINVMPATKEEVMTFTRMYKEELLSGTHDSLKELAKLKHIEKFLKNVLTDDEIDALMVREMDKYGKEKMIEIGGFKMNLQDTGVKYLYEDCGDPVWNDLVKQINELDAKRKEREKFLQNIPYDKGTVDPETGVFITRPPKVSKTKVVVK